MSGWRIAVLGNSHAAALKLGWDAASGCIPGIASLDVFARPNGSGALDGLRLNGHVIEPDDDELRRRFVQTSGVDHIDLERFDAFLLHSFGPRPNLIYDAAKSLNGHRYSTALMSTYLGEYRKAVAARFGQSPIAQLCRLLRQGTRAPLYATHKPLFAKGIPRYRQPLQTGAVMFAVFQDGIREAFTALDCRMLPQPPRTIVAGCFTDPPYANEDMKHMNAEYGLLVLRALAAELGDGPP